MTFRYQDPKELRRRHDAAGGLHKPALAVQGSETSNQAARQIERYRPNLKVTVYNAIATSADGLTAQELETATGLAGNTVRPRIVELVEANLVRDSHRTRPTKANRQAVVWIVTE